MSSEFEDEILLLKELEKKNIKAFGKFYKRYAGDLLIIATAILSDHDLAVQAVDDVFEKLWEEPRFGQIKPPIYTFLYQELRKYVRNKR